MKTHLTLGFCALFLLSLGSSVEVYGQVPDYVPTEGLVGWWNFDGNTMDEIGAVDLGRKAGFEEEPIRQESAEWCFEEFITSLGDGYHLVQCSDDLPTMCDPAFNDGVEVCSDSSNIYSCIVEINNDCGGGYAEFIYTQTNVSSGTTWTFVDVYVVADQTPPEWLFFVTQEYNIEWIDANVNCQLNVPPLCPSAIDNCSCFNPFHPCLWDINDINPFSGSIEFYDNVQELDTPGYFNVWRTWVAIDAAGNVSEEFVQTIHVTDEQGYYQTLGDANGNGICDGEEIAGCTDIEACNYWIWATIDDGSCVFENCECICQDFYSPACDYEIPPPAGCADPMACNFDPEWICEAQYCTYPPDGDCNCDGNQLDAIGICGGNCQMDVNGNGICDDEEIAGCTDIEACNYWEPATINDGSCVFENCGCLCYDFYSPACDAEFTPPAGCADPLACNYDPEWTCTEQVCLYPEGGLDLDSDGLCDYQDNCYNLEACNFDDPNNVSCIYPGCSDLSAINFNPDAGCPGPCLYIGCMDVEACNYNAQADFDDGSCLYPGAGGECCCCIDYDCPSCNVLDLIPGCSDSAACNYIEGYSCETQYCEYPPDGDCDCDGNQLDVLGICGGNCEADLNANGICDDDEFSGCTNPEACNFMVLAVVEDDSCVFPLVPGDCWAGSTACGNGTYWNPLLQQCLVPECGACEGDLLEDGIVNAGDLLVFLGAFGSVCPPTGCTDPTALNFQEDATADDGSCEFCAPVTYNGHQYATVQVNGQCWFAENLQTRVYANGDSIPPLNQNTGGSNYDGIGRIALHPNPDYIAHYTWHAVTDARGLCPAGWHVSTDLDWYTIEAQLGYVPSNSGSDNGWRGEGGIQLKSQNGWVMDGNGTNALGFNGMPCGNHPSLFDNEGVAAFFWSPQTSNPTITRSRKLRHDEIGINRGTDASYQGFSVRCVKDNE